MPVLGDDAERARCPDERELGNPRCRSGGFELNARLRDRSRAARATSRRRQSPPGKIHSTRAIKDMLDEPSRSSAGEWGIQLGLEVGAVCIERGGFAGASWGVSAI